MLVLLSFGLVLVATVLLVLGLLVGEGLTLIYLSIGLSLLAAVVLLVAVRLGRPKVDAKTEPEPLPEPIESTPAPVAHTAEVPAATPQAVASGAVESAGAATATATLARPGGEDEWLASDEEWNEAGTGGGDGGDEEVEFPIADYDELTSDEILPLLPQLYTDEIDVVAARERATKARVGVLDALGDLRERRARGEAPEPDDAGWEEEVPAPAVAASVAASVDQASPAKEAEAWA
ncbi:MAG: hypothetical protein ACRD0U_05835, partial [Acidimicrobiales bacterium]